MYTSVSWLVLASFFHAPLAPQNSDLVWMRSYEAARKVARATGRPLVVFVAPNGDAQANVIREGTLDTETRKVLRDHFVCVQLDSTHSTAQSFEFSKGQGIVVSDRSGGYQAFRCDGTMPDYELRNKLTQIAEGEEATVRRTISYYPPTVAAPAARPANC